jgi:hypothetical protein
MPEVQLKDTPEYVHITGTDFSIVFSKASGTIVSWYYNNQKLIEKGPIPNLWRAPVDNDKGGDKRSFSYRWIEAGLDDLKNEVIDVTAFKIKPQAVRIIVRIDLIAKKDKIEYTGAYTVLGNGEILLDNQITAGSTLPPLPRIGINLRLPADYNTFSWYGRGPHESYWDRKTGAAIGFYSGSVEDQYIPYVMPQENGNKTDVRWACLTNKNNVGLLISGMPSLNVSVHNYTIENLTQARHTHEIEKSEFITWNLDYQQMGLGGDDSWNPRTHKEYLLFPGTYIYSMRLSPVASSISDATQELKYDLPLACAPVIRIHASPSTGKEEVEINTVNVDSQIYYSTDGSIPDKNSQKYLGKFLVEENTAVRAIEYREGLIPSVISYVK